MGQKRTHNMMDKKIGVYLADFEKDLTDKIDQAFTDRLDHLIETEEKINENVEEAADFTNQTAEFARSFASMIQKDYGMVGFLGGIGGAGFVLLVQWVISLI